VKLLYVVQAYGPDVFGGAESHCRMMATRMAARGHDVDVLTSCAVSYYDWANYYKPGTSDFEGVTIHRLPVTAPRNHELFGPLSARVLSGYKPIPLFIQQRWIDTQGPHMPGLPQWIWDHALNYDAVIFFTYLYYPTVRGLPMASGRVPTVLHALAHDEPPLYLPVFDQTFKLPTGFAFSVEEDAELMRKRARPSQLQAIIGIGTDLEVSGNVSAFRRQFEIPDDPYVVCVGRLDPAKGSDELFDYFKTYKERNPGPLKLVLVGEPVKPLPPHDDVIVTGYVDQDVRNGAVAGAVASIHPSYFESFSMALTEAWAQRRPAIVNGHCEVLVGQARRSGGGLPYLNFAEFEEALDLVAGSDVLAKRFGEAGRRYTEERYNWTQVMDRYERFIGRVPAI
jgi:glycosyltransferase involved in cell wall biosynthesis